MSHLKRNERMGLRAVARENEAYAAEYLLLCSCPQCCDVALRAAAIDYAKSDHSTLYAGKYGQTAAIVDAHIFAKYAVAERT